MAKLVSKASFKAHANGRNKCQQLPTLLGAVGQQCCVRLHEPKSLTSFKLYATSANIVVIPCKRTQQVTTLLGPTMLGPFAWALTLASHATSINPIPPGGGGGGEVPAPISTFENSLDI